jgi:filamentous hemagglutinin family protein
MKQTKNIKWIVASRTVAAVILLLLASSTCPVAVRANPVGGSVTQGGATFKTSGNQFTITQTSGSAYVNWQSFNIGAGETTTFVQPSSTSVIWNNINDANASQILGTLNANGYVVLQNASGFYIGGDASITAHGLILTTASTPPLNLSSGGSWEFDAPPPAAKIINYGKINITGAGWAFLIASDIENANDGTHAGTVSAPGGKIGLYAGQKVLVSLSPDGRGLSATVTLPEGSVDNEGNLIADAGSIAAQAQFVNQNGLVQANSVQNNNGVIEFVASDSLNIGANSAISAKGDSTSASASPGGFVVLKAANSFADTGTSAIDVSGNSQGATGFVEIFGANVADATSINSSINGVSASSFYSQNHLFINPYDLTFSTSGTDPTSGNVQFSDLAAYSQIDFHALDDISLGSDWSLANQNSAAALNLTAGNDINLDYSIVAGNNWSVGLTAGSGSSPLNGGIYLNGGSVVQTQDGNINLWALNEVIVEDGAVRTLKGGSIAVTAQQGDVNTGDNTGGYTFGLGRNTAGPYYAVNSANLGGISTAAGGNVTINAGLDVVSYLPVQSDYVNAAGDAGAGAFGAQAGNVTINAGRNVYGHYVVADGTGTINAGGDVGAPVSVLENNSGDGFALSLIKGSWIVDAPNGNIYVQDVRNPNGIFGEKRGLSAANYNGYHYFDYDSSSSVAFNAGDSVEITGYDAPHTPPSNPSLFIPILLPPSFTVTTGSGDFVLDTTAILFPSADQNLNLNIGGNFVGVSSDGNPINLVMSDSASSRWTKDGDFGTGDHAATLTPQNDPNPVEITVAGSMSDVNLYTTKATEITVGGDMINSGFVGQNQKAGDTTSINVTGQIYNSPFYTFASLTDPITSANPQQSSVWDSVFLLAVNPDMVDQITSFDAKTAPGANGLAYYLKTQNYLLFPSDVGNSGSYGSNPGFIYDPSSKQLGFAGNTGQLISPAQLAALEGGTFTVLVADSKGVPILDANNHLQVISYTFSAAPAIAGLYEDGLKASSTSELGFQIGGPGTFDVHAGSMDLGNSPGIVSYGFGGKYGYLQDATGALGSGGAAINLDVDGNLSMITSAIDSIDGGDVNVKVGGEVKISQGNFDFQTSSCYGIYTSGYSDVHVTAGGDIDIGSGCIGAFNGGSVYVTSLNGDVNAGNGANKALFVYGIFLSPSTGLPIFGTIGDLADPVSLQADPAPYGSGILAEFPTPKYQLAGGLTQPGNIFVDTPNGNIISSRGGISQFALNGSIAGGPVVTLNAGTPGITATPGQGNITLGQGGVVGGTINITASGAVEGLIVSRQNANINVAQGFTGTVLSGGSANFSGGGSVAGTVVGIGGVSVTGNAIVTATVLSQNVTIGTGASLSTLGTSANATSASQSAAQQSSSDAKQQLASDDTNADDEKRKKRPALLHVKRVTIILPKAS